MEYFCNKGEAHQTNTKQLFSTSATRCPLFLFCTRHQTMCHPALAPSIKNKFKSSQRRLIKFPTMFKSNLAQLVSISAFLPHHCPESKPSICIFDPPQSTQEQWFDLRQRWHRRRCLSVCDSAVKVCYGSPMAPESVALPFEPPRKRLWTLSSTCDCSEVRQQKASGVAKQLSFELNSIRLPLCVFVSFRSHLAITGANLRPAPGYSVKMTDLSRPPTRTYTHKPSPTPRSRVFTTPGVSLPAP